LASAKELEWLDLKDGEIAVEDLDEVAQITSLRKLVLANCKIEDGAITALETLPNLKTLDLSSTSFSLAKLEEVVKLQALETLVLADSDIDDGTLTLISVKLPALKHLDVRNTLITEKGLLELRKLHKLESVDVRGAALAKPSQESLKRALHGAAVIF
jgi:Leucine-rich repeat (LRR) protein